MKRVMLLILVAFPAFAETIHWTNGVWFDGTRFRKAEFYTVERVLKSKRPPRVDRVIDLRGRYVVPAFGDAHHHGVDSIAGLDTKVEAFLDAGVFYVKNPNVIPDLLSPEVRAKINHRRGVDVVFSNGGLTKSGGHPVRLHEILSKRGVFPGLTPSDMPNRAYFTIASEAELDAKWPLIISGKPDFIKTFLLFSGTARAEGLDPGVLSAIVRRAHAAGLRVSSHVETAEDFGIAVRAGVDEINHLPTPQDGDLAAYVIDNATAKLAATKNTVVVTTVRPIRMPGAPAVAVKPELIANQMKNVATLARAGVKLALGSDGISGEEPFATARDEALYLHGHRFATNLSLLKMWSENTPRTIFPNRKIGALQDGFEASFLVLDGNPLEDFKNVTRISMRVKEGVLL